MSEGLHIPSLGGATVWLNSEPLGPAELRGNVVMPPRRSEHDLKAS